VISRELIELMGGHLTLVSDLGKGSDFSFTIPVELAEHQSVGSPEDDRKSLAGLRVLAIDDNATNREILGHQTAFWNMRCELAENGASGLEKVDDSLQNGAYDLILLDLDMPGMDGMEVAQRLKTNPLTRSIPIIMLTSVGAYGDIQKSKDVGIDLYLTKPLRQRDLFSAIYSVVYEPEKVVNRETQNEIQEHNARQARKFGLKVLVVEDNTTNQLVAIKMLRKLGCDTQVVGNGLEAVDAFGKSEYDLILMDCQMPVMDGFQATKRIREFERRSPEKVRTPIIALTANALLGDRETCIEVGMDDYISKPFLLEQMASTLSYWFPEEGGADLTGAGENKGLGVDQISQNPDAGEPILERALLEQIRELQMDDEPDLVSEVISTYLQDTEQIMENLLTADFTAANNVVKSSAHTLKSSSANVGAMRLSGMAKRLEEQCEGNSAEENKVLIQNLQVYYARTKTELQKELN
jgi:CheY-like chemotaxis protein